MATADSIDLKNKQAVIVGLRGSGKSNLAMHIAKQVPPNEVLIYDPLGEWHRHGYRAHIPEDNLSSDELDEYVGRVVIRAEPRLFVVDEAGSILRTKSRLPRNLQALRAHGRHYGIAVIWIAHRPVDINPNITEIADYIFIFGTSGSLDENRLREWHRDIPKLCADLGQYEFVVLENGRTATIHAAVPDAKG